MLEPKIFASTKHLMCLEASLATTLSDNHNLDLFVTNYYAILPSYAAYTASLGNFTEVEVAVVTMKT